MTGIPIEHFDHLLDVERLRLDAVDCPVRYDVWRQFALRGPETRLSLLLERTEANPAPGSSQLAAEVQRRMQAVDDARPELSATGTPSARVSVRSPSGHVAAPEPARALQQRTRSAFAFGEWVLIEANLLELLTAVLPLTSWGGVVSHLASLDGSNLERQLFPPDGIHREDDSEGDSRVGWLSRVFARLWGVDPDLETERHQGANDLRRRLALVGARSDPLSQNGWEGAISPVNLDRLGAGATERSVPVVKADAATRLFATRLLEIDCSELTWAVIDSGIDARHPAFADTAGIVPTRVTTIIDFTRIQDLRQFEELRTATSFVDAVNEVAALDPPSGTNDPAWGDSAPRLGHGTHVAAILAGVRFSDGATVTLGMCPTLRLWDLRVIDDNDDILESRVLLALQYVREYNRLARSKQGVAGVNMSISIPYDPRAHACGWTPVCTESRRLIRSGVVVVVAAGNEGFDRAPSVAGTAGVGYASIGITDPGNTEEAITVGATSRDEPYRYGASYFSSKGPTADGRPKPDLLAPGEHIYSASGRHSCVPKDGTSQAAPHVSGAAALLIARYPELLNEPERIKSVLCATATNLGRDRYFQGHGLLDVLRAMQAV